MTSMIHDHLVRMIGISLANNDLSIVTQLMRYGCLLDYVREHQRRISGKAMLLWAKQIANASEQLCL
jgi:hypothetical protein